MIPSELGFLNSLLEEFEGIAVMRTVDRKTGHLKFWVPEDQMDLLCKVFDDFIHREWMFEYHLVEPWWDVV